MTSAKNVSTKLEQARSAAKSAESDNVSVVAYETVGDLPQPETVGAQRKDTPGTKSVGHWSRQPSIVTRFWSHVHKTETCWLWTGERINRQGYGRIHLGRPRTKTALRWLAHRFSWELHYGQIPDGLYVCHRCDNPICVRPEHLFLGTSQDNQLDAVRKGRSRSRLTPEQVRAIREARATGEGVSSLGARYGVAKSTISEIVNRRIFGAIN